MAYLALLGSAALINWMDVPEAAEPEFNDWYTTEHLPERIGVPGFQRGRRFVSADPASRTDRYFTLYETRDLSVLESPDYLARLDSPTPWTVAQVKNFVSQRRAASQLLVSRGNGTSGSVLVLEATASEGGREFVEAAFETLIGQRTATSAHLYETDEAVTNAKSGTREGAGTAGGGATLPGWTILVELTERSRAGLAQDLLSGKGSDAPVPVSIDSAQLYDLMVELVSAE